MHSVSRPVSNNGAGHHRPLNIPRKFDGHQGSHPINPVSLRYMEMHSESPNVGYSLHGNRYLNITSRCTLRCDFCPKFSGCWTVQDYDLRLRGTEPTTGENFDLL